MTAFLETVLSLLNKKGVSKNKMLTDLNLGKNSFVNWENRGTIPGGETLNKIADYFEVPTDYLLGKDTSSRFSDKQLHVLDLFNQLTESQQDNLIGRAEALIEENKRQEEITYHARAVAYGGANTDTEISAADLEKAQSIIRKLLEEQQGNK